MTNRSILSVTLVTAALLAVGCGGTATNNNANTAVVVNANKPAAAETGNAAPTLTPVFKAYCDAMVKKDEAAIRKAYSADTIKYFEEDMKDQKITTLVKYLETDGVTGNICEVRNEVITGDRAVAEIRTDAYPNGIKIEFVKEGGEWKITNKSPTLDAVKPNANSAPAANADSKPVDPAANKDK